MSIYVFTPPQVDVYFPHFIRYALFSSILINMPIATFTASILFLTMRNVSLRPASGVTWESLLHKFDLTCLWVYAMSSSLISSLNHYSWYQHLFHVWDWFWSLSSVCSLLITIRFIQLLTCGCHVFITSWQKVLAIFQHGWHVMYIARRGLLGIPVASKVPGREGLIWSSPRSGSDGHGLRWSYNSQLTVPCIVIPSVQTSLWISLQDRNSTIIDEILTTVYTYKYIFRIRIAGL